MNLYDRFTIYTIAIWCTLLFTNNLPHSRLHTTTLHQTQFISFMKLIDYKHGYRTAVIPAGCGIFKWAAASVAATAATAGTITAIKTVNDKIRRPCPCPCHDLRIGTPEPLCRICPKNHPHGLYRAKADHHPHSRGNHNQG